MQQEAMTKEEILSQHYDVLGHYLVDGYTEIRDIKRGKSEYVKSKEEFIEAGKKFLDKDIYVGVNPRSKEAGDASSISHVSCLVLDIDPVRAKGAPSTNEQHESAIALAKRIVEDFRGGFVISSGSGAHIYFPIQPLAVTNAEALTESLRRWMTAIREKYGTEELKLDPIFDLPRVIRLWGSFNTKSKRVCSPLGPINSFERMPYSFKQEQEDKTQPRVTSESEQRLLTLAKNHKRLRHIIEGIVSYESPSEADYEFIRILVEAHFTESDIESLWQYNKAGNKEPKKNDIARITTKVNLEREENVVSLVHTADRYKASLKTRKMGMRTGISGLDHMTSGLKGGKLIILAAQPGDGKTSLGVQVADYVAQNYGPVILHPTELGHEPVFDKIISRRSGVGLKKFQNGTFNEKDQEKINDAIETVKTLPIVVIEDFTLTVDKLISDYKKHVPVVGVIDFFQALSWNDPANANEKYAGVKRIKKLAQDMNIPIILMSQLKRGNEKPSLSSLSETKALEEYGDIIAFLTCENRLGSPRQVELEVKKSKYSELGVVKLEFNCSTCSFK